MSTAPKAPKTKAKTNLSRVPTNALWKELERRSSKQYLRRVRQEYRYLKCLKFLSHKTRK